MLVLTRKHGEAIMIGDDIVVVFLGHSGNQARIGIGAPKDLKVYRQEIYDRIKEQQE